MRRRVLGGLVTVALLAGAGGGLSCRTPPAGRPFREPPPPGLTPTTLDYTDTDGFDQLFENALVNQDPAILILTGRERPDWGSRLNAWIAAWNMGGKVGPPPRAVRAQAPLPSVTVDGESLREFRLLVDSLLDRVEDIAGRQSAWWAEEKMRSRRVALLRPYNLRFHKDEDNRIQLIFFNGDYKASYAGFMKTMRTGAAGDMEWSRSVECSECRDEVGG